jgi:hypothetical protein
MAATNEEMKMRMVREHNGITDAIEDGDSATADRIARQHTELGFQGVTSIPPDATRITTPVDATPGGRTRVKRSAKPVTPV